MCLVKQMVTTLALLWLCQLTARDLLQVPLAIAVPKAMQDKSRSTISSDVFGKENHVVSRLHV